MGKYAGDIHILAWIPAGTSPELPDSVRNFPRGAGHTPKVQKQPSQRRNLARQDLFGFRLISRNPKYLDGDTLCSYSVARMRGCGQARAKLTWRRVLERLRPPMLPRARRLSPTPGGAENPKQSAGTRRSTLKAPLDTSTGVHPKVCQVNIDRGGSHSEARVLNFCRCVLIR